MKLVSFPAPVPEELFSSVIARHMARYACFSTALLRSMQLRRQTAFSAICPPSLPTFVETLPSGHPWHTNAYNLIFNHTLIPFFVNFSHQDLRLRVVKSIATGVTGNTLSSVGGAVRKLLHSGSFWKICSACVSRDIQRFGHKVIYRYHQPAMVRVCHQHQFPLVHCCLQCHTMDNKSHAWISTDSCHCKVTAPPPQLGHTLEPRESEFLVRIAQMVHDLLKLDPAVRGPSPPATLLATFRNLGFTTSRQITAAKAISNLLHTVVDDKIWSLTQLDRAPGADGTHQRFNAVWGPDVLTGRQAADPGLSLLLLYLSEYEIADTPRPPFTSNPLPGHATTKSNPRGHGGRQRPHHLRVDRETLSQAVCVSTKLTVAAQQLGISSYSLAADLLNARIRYPLSKACIKRISIKRLEEIREALKAGRQKKVIMSEYGVSEWTLMLVMLDRPELVTLQREAEIQVQRSRHRAALLKYLDCCSLPTRSGFQSAHAGALDWLREFDQAWLTSHWPDRVRKAPGLKLQHRRAKTLEKDANAVIEIRNSVEYEHTKEERPTQLTKSGLLAKSCVSVSAALAVRTRFPLAAQEASGHAETKEQFYERVLTWALKEYSTLHIPISMNKFRRVARLPAHVIAAHRSFVFEQATQMRLRFVPGCCLSFVKCHDHTSANGE
ncbi:MAG: hypothetical protein E2591_29110 [Achromobacter sp.]|uniref:TniQ family protein n=1 Tax=Achromobacter sp. TaxID=134375 RepID=UPI0012C733F5|nr:TniQ family protein [Achromobacter sp.]MPS82135.1 hypothetical protein [Achromobacter sp.]